MFKLRFIYTISIILANLCLFESISFGQQTITGNISHNSTNRNYRLRLPANHDKSVPIPLVFNLHGYTSNAVQQEIYSGMNNIADTARFAVCYPNGIGAAWNVGWTFGSNADDVGFISLLIDDLVQKHGFDSNRIYACGMSNGGFMSYKLACELNNKIAAIASVTGSMVPAALSSCKPNRSVPVLEIHGTADDVVSYQGSAGLNASIPDVLKFWQKNNECDESPNIEMVPDINTTDNTTSEKWTYTNCNLGNELMHFKVIGGGHTWPGALLNLGVTSRDFNASEEIWLFFKKYSLPETSNIKEESFANEFRYAPNPVQDNLRITYLGSEGLLQLKNIQGQILFSSKLSHGENQIDLSDLHPQMLIATIYESNSLQSFKIVKCR